MSSLTTKNRIVVIDFEVYRFDWILGYSYFDYDADEIHYDYIHNDVDALRRFYEESRERILVGHNIDNYDDKILQALYDGKESTLYQISQQLVNREGRHKLSGLITFDTLSQPISNNPVWKGLKHLTVIKGFPAYDCSVDWDIQRRLTDEEVEEVLDYNYLDVYYETLVFKHYYNNTLTAKIEYCNNFNLPMQSIRRSWAMLASDVVPRKKLDKSVDLNSAYYIDDVRLELGKYQYILDKIPRDREITLSSLPVFNVNNLPHKLASGGIHGASESAYNAYAADGRLVWFADVVGYYSALQISFNTQSRKIANKNFVEEMRSLRSELKKSKNRREKCYKALLVIIYGVTRQERSPLYDKLMGYNTCLYGQLALIDLVDKIEDADPSFKLIQSNTDGIAFHTDDIELVKDIAAEWEHRLDLELEYDSYAELFQKDVNNYVCFNDLTDIKCKGAVVNKYEINDLNYNDHNTRWGSLGVVNKLLYESEVIDDEFDISTLSLLDMQIVKTASDEKGRAKNKTLGFGILRSDGTIEEYGRDVRVYFVDKYYDGVVGTLVSLKADGSHSKTQIPGINDELRKRSSVRMIVFNGNVRVDSKACKYLKSHLDYKLYNKIIDSWVEDFGGNK